MTFPPDDSIEKHSTNNNNTAYRSGCSRCFELEQQLAELHAKHSTKRACTRWLKGMRVPYTVEFREPRAFVGVLTMIVSATGVFMLGLAVLIGWVQNGIDFSVITPAYYRAFAVFMLCTCTMLAPVTKFKRRDNNS